MTAADFRTALAALGLTQRGFATFTGSNERTVRRWASAEQDIPPWVPVMIRLLERDPASIVRTDVPDGVSRTGISRTGISRTCPSDDVQTARPDQVFK